MAANNIEELDGVVMTEAADLAALKLAEVLLCSRTASAASPMTLWLDVSELDVLTTSLSSLSSYNYTAKNSFFQGKGR